MQLFLQCLKLNYVLLIRRNKGKINSSDWIYLFAKVFFIKSKLEKLIGFADGNNKYCATNKASNNSYGEFVRGNYCSC